jgi:hypothetical protein
VYGESNIVKKDVAGVLNTVAGCPCVVCNLWSVSVVEENRLMRLLAGSWSEGRESEESSDKSSCLQVSLHNAKKELEFPFLTGSSCVSYGLPVYWKHKK